MWRAIGAIGALMNRVLQPRPLVATVSVKTVSWGRGNYYEIYHLLTDDLHRHADYIQSVSSSFKMSSSSGLGTQEPACYPLSAETFEPFARFNENYYTNV